MVTVRICTVTARRAADSSTNWRQGFVCRRTASMEHAAERSTTTFRRQLKTFQSQRPSYRPTIVSRCAVQATRLQLQLDAVESVCREIFKNGRPVALSYCSMNACCGWSRDRRPPTATSKQQTVQSSSFHRRFYRAMLCIRGTSHGPVSVRVCVCLCLCRSQVRVLLKRLNV